MSSTGEDLPIWIRLQIRIAAKIAANSPAVSSAASDGRFPSMGFGA